MNAKTRRRQRAAREAAALAALASQPAQIEPARQDHGTDALVNPPSLRPSDWRDPSRPSSWENLRRDLRNGDGPVRNRMGSKWDVIGQGGHFGRGQPLRERDKFTPAKSVGWSGW